MFKGAFSNLGVSTSTRTPRAVPAVSSQTSEAADQLGALPSPFPALDATSTLSTPQWAREMNAERVRRHSRASSIVSTRTRFSTTTLQDDARSIDINVGGQYFRISRDGSRITADAPPPYPGPARETASIDGRRQPPTPASMPAASADESAENWHESETPRTSLASLNLDPGLRANILDPSEFDMPSPIDVDQSGERSSSATVRATTRVSNHGPLADGESELFSAPAELPRSRTLSPMAGLHNPLPQPSSPLRRRNGIRLPRLITNSVGPDGGLGPGRWRANAATTRSASSHSPLQVRSAGPILSTCPRDETPSSPAYIGRGADGVFPLLREPRATRVEETPASPDDHSTPLPMDSENEISLHYARMMRRLDRDHRKALHLKDTELAEYRERLNEMDTVYRQELKARDFIIDDLKKRLAHLEENMEAKIEKARNEVEDLWESRWKDRDFHLRERMRRMEEEAKRTVDGIVLAGP